MHSELAAVPRRTRAVVFVTVVDGTAIRAVAAARALRPYSCEGLYASDRPADIAEIRREWDAARIPVALTAVASRGRGAAGSVQEYLREIHREAPGELLMVFLPCGVRTRWWQNWWATHRTRRLSRMLLRLPGVVVTLVSDAQPEESP